ncbi:MAG: DNA-directed RNA polymerase subunit omega [Actinobacteria bacterium RBG_19FT_COMBO_36_27]|nr:MAG: DNA-directed RNA polymerase subunit omega [Actinobacteria bacterium RBG_19FT_COMBO_36_27]
MKVQYVDEYKNSIDSKYKLCIAAAKRARELGEYLSAQKNMERINVIKPLVDVESHDPLEIAFNEIKEEKVTFEKSKKESV